MIETNYKPLMLHIQKICDENNIRLYTDYDKVMFENEKKEKPYAVFHVQSSGAIEEQEGMDLKNECRGGMVFNLIIEAEKIDDIIHLEESISKPLDNSVLYYPRANGKTLEATITLVPDQPSERKVVDGEGTTEKHYQSTYYFQCLGMVFPKIIEHPVQIELDRRKQLNALLRLSFIEYVYNNIKQQMHKLFYVEDHEEFTSAEEKFVEMLQDDALREQYTKLHKQLEELKCQCAEMYNFENICEDKLTMEDEGFRFCYLQMITNSLDLVSATKKYREHKEARKEPDIVIYRRAITQWLDTVATTAIPNLKVFPDHQQMLENIYLTKRSGAFSTVDISYEFDTLWYDYKIIDENGNMSEKKIDYTSMMPITVLAQMTLCSSEQEQLNQVVKNIQKAFSDKQSLRIVQSIINNETLCITGELVGETGGVIVEEIEDKKYYWTFVNIAYSHCLWNEKNEKNCLSEKEQLERIISLITIRKQIEQKREEIENSEQDDEKKETDELRNLARQIDKFVFEDSAEKLNIPREHRREYYYANYYQLLCQKGCDIESASKIISKEVQARIAKRECARKEALLQGSGDVTINRVTDRVVEDLKERLGNDVPIYGGSTYAEWYLKRDCKNDLSYPNIILKAQLGYDSEQKEYCNMSEVGEEIRHPYSPQALPLTHTISCRIYGKEKEEVLTVQKRIYECYFNKNVRVLIPDSVMPGEYSVYEIILEPETSNSIKSENRNGEVIWHVFISFEEQLNVYYTDTINENKVSDTKDTVLQLSYITQAEYCSSQVESLDEAIKCLDVYYKSLFDYGFLSNLFCTEEYKKLKNSIKDGQSIDIKLFNKVFQNITDYYPLFNKFAYGWSYEQIREDISGIQMQYRRLVDMLAELAGIPKKIEVNYIVDDEISKDLEKVCTDMDETMACLGFEPVGDVHAINTTSINPREKEALTIYRRAMYADIYCTIDDAINKYRKKQGDRLEVEERQRRQWEAEQQALAEMRAQEAEYEFYDGYDSGGHSSGSGFFSSLLSSSIANAGIKREMKKQTKLMREQAEREKERERMASQRERDERHRAAVESQWRFDAVMRENRERRRKGQPELPLPPRTWY